MSTLYTVGQRVVCPLCIGPILSITINDRGVFYLIGDESGMRVPVTFDESEVQEVGQ